MPGPEIVGVVLAAGMSRRFGASNKLTALLAGRPLVQYAALAVKTALPDAAFAIIAPEHDPVATALHGLGLSVVTNPIAAEGIGTSVARAARLASELGARRLLLALGDMPFVTPGHLLALLSMGGEEDVVATAPGRPPLVFARRRFDELVALRGDQGARHLVRNARLVEARPIAELDIDTTAELAGAEKLFSCKKTIA